MMGTTGSRHKKKKDYKEYFAMKKCVPRTSDRIITVVAAIVCAIVAFFAFRELFYGKQSPVVFLGISIMFSGVAIHTIWRTIYMGKWGFFYNDEKIIFVLSSKDRREFRWDELKNGEPNIFIHLRPPHGISISMMKRK